MDKSTLEKIVEAATEMAKVKSTGGTQVYDSKIVGPIAAALVSKAIESQEVRIALIGQ